MPWLVGIIIVIAILWAIIRYICELIYEYREGILNFLKVIALIAVAVFVLVFVLPKIWPIILSGWKNALSNWPFLLFILACLGANKLIKRTKVRKFVMWIDSVGITEKSTVPASQKILSSAERHGSITILDSGHILSTDFCNRVLHWLEQPMAVSKEVIQSGCLQLSPNFQSAYSEVLLNYLSDIGKLLHISGTEVIYFSNSLKDMYIALFKKKGGATENEFANICTALDTGSTISPDPHAVAVTILDYLVSTGVAEKVELKEKDEILFKCTRITADSEFVRREISLDD